MTVKEIYEQTIKPLNIDDRAILADLILDDLEIVPSNKRLNHNELISMLEEGMEGDAVPVTADTWTELDKLIDAHADPTR